MKVSVNWIKDYIALDETPQVIADRLTGSGLEVEGIEKYESIKGGLEGLVIGEVKSCEQHPNADRLKITQVDIGTGELQPIVCGAPNVAQGQKVVVATIGATLYPAGHEPFKIKKSKIRGEISLGMICAEDEIGLGESHEGILTLKTDLANGTPAAEYFKPENDTVLEIGLTPNRADATSHIGVARELQALTGNKYNKPDLSSFQEGSETPMPVEVKDTAACPRYSSISLKGVKIEESPDWLKNKLESIGVSPINNVVDITNFVLHEYGQPLHAFDMDKITAGKVVVQKPAKGTPFTTLDEVERKLTGQDLMICNGDEPMCIAGVFGGLHSGITSSTKNVFLESAYFSPDTIRKSAQKHTLKTDASFRYERGADPNITIEALKRAATLIRDICGGSIASTISDYYPDPVKPRDIKVKYAHINRLIGAEISKEQIHTILEGLEITILEEDKDYMLLSVPPYRVDVTREADIIEEILRIYGYDNIEIDGHFASDYLAQFPEKDIEKTKKLIAGVLTGKGFFEIITNSLTRPAYAGWTNTIDENQQVPILNKLSEDLGVMRQSLLFQGMEVLAHNIKRRQTNLKVYETGKTYSKVDGKYNEEEKLAIFIAGDQLEESWRSKTQDADFYDLKQAFAEVLTKLNLNESYEAKARQHDLYSYGMEIIIGKKTLGYLGQVHPKIANKFDIEQPVFAAELSLKVLHEAYDNKKEYIELSKFPEVRRDLSLVLDKQVSYKDIKNLITETEKGPGLINSVNVFDVYEGENIEKNKKSYSVSVTLQDTEKTLTDKVIDKTMDNIMKRLEKELNALIRK